MSGAKSVKTWGRGQPRMRWSAASKASGDASGRDARPKLAEFVAAFCLGLVPAVFVRVKGRRRAQNVAVLVKGEVLHGAFWVGWT